MISRRGSAKVAEPVASPYEPLGLRLRPPTGSPPSPVPQLPAGSVPRTPLVNLLRDSRAVAVILVSAPAGYGKTTLLAQWASASRRPFAWVALDDEDDDPIVLLNHIAAALDGVSALDPGVFEALGSAGASIEGKVVPRLAAALARLEPSFVLVLDDLHALTNPQCLDAIDAIIDHIPPGSQMALSGRVVRSRRAGALRPHGLVLEIGPDELGMNQDDARDLLRAADVRLPDAELANLVERTEGWPAGLYLAALSVRKGRELADATTFRRGDRFVSDYLRSELLSRLPQDELRFLTRTAVLDRMCGPLCDAVLESRGSAGMLESLRRSNRFVVALDRNREWYRYHHLFRELLRGELERAEPDLSRGILARAANWCEANGEPEAAVGYAQAAGDVERVAGLVAAHGQSVYQRGRAVTVDRWFDWLERHGGLQQSPGVAALGAVLSAVRGRSAEAERWADAAERGVLEGARTNDGASVELWLALVRAMQCRRGVERMRADALLAVRGFGRASPWWPTAASLLAISHMLSGEDDRADDLFADVAEAAVAMGAWNAGSLALAERALLAIERGDWLEADALTDRADSIVRRSRMEDYPPNVLVYAASARVAVHRGDLAAADELLARAQRLRPQLTHALSPLAIQARIELARAYTGRADVAGARTLLREAGGLFRHGRDFGTLTVQARDLRSKLKSATVEAPGASTLTTAELRVLPYLATHLSFREIGERLYISRHTVKSHAIAVYRKLNVTSRNAAVERARELGLL